MKYSLPILLVLFFSNVCAQSTWDGGAGTNNWTDANNWNPNGVPANNANVTIGAGASVRITSAIANTTGNLIIQNGGSLEITTGGSLIHGANDQLTVSNSSQLIISGGTLTLGNNAAVNFTTSSQLTVSAGLFDIDDNATFNNVTITISGGTLQAGDDNNDLLSLTNGATLNMTGGTINARDLTFTNATVDLDGGSLDAVDWIVGGNTVLTVDGTNINDITSFTSQGTSNTTFTSGGLEMTGHLTLLNTSVVNIAMSFVNDGPGGDRDIRVRNGSTLNINTGANVSGFDDIEFDTNDAAVATININGGNISAVDDIKMTNSVNDVININSGTLSVPNNIDIGNSNVVINVNGGSLEAGSINDNSAGTNGVSNNINVSGSGTVSEGGSVVLPVDLISFSATLDEGKALITWETASELNNERFDLQKSSDGLNFLTIASLAGNGTTNERKSYSFIDKNLTVGIFYYRLVQYDFDGASEILPTIAVFNQVAPQNSILNIYPNPVIHDYVTITLQGQIVSNPWSAALYNMKGQLILQKNGTTGSPTLTLEGLSSRTEPGMYLLYIQGKAENFSRRIIIE